MKAKMTKENLLNLIDCLQAAEQENFKRYMENNPTDTQRVHDHNIILGTYSQAMHFIREEFEDER